MFLCIVDLNATISQHLVFLCWCAISHHTHNRASNLAWSMMIFASLMFFFICFQLSTPKLKHAIVDLKQKLLELESDIEILRAKVDPSAKTKLVEHLNQVVFCYVTFCTVFYHIIGHLIQTPVSHIQLRMKLLYHILWRHPVRHRPLSNPSSIFLPSYCFK